MLCSYSSCSFLQVLYAHESEKHDAAVVDQIELVRVVYKGVLNGGQLGTHVAV